MTIDEKVTAKELGQEFYKRGKTLLQQSSVRHVVVRNANGAKVFEINLTLAVIMGVIAFAFAWWLMLILTFLGYIAKWRVEVIRELSEAEDDSVIIEDV